MQLAIGTISVWIDDNELPAEVTASKESRPRLYHNSTVVFDVEQRTSHNLFNVVGKLTGDKMDIVEYRRIS